jgi:plastocyanin
MDNMNKIGLAVGGFVLLVIIIWFVASRGGSDKPKPAATAPRSTQSETPQAAAPANTATTSVATEISMTGTSFVPSSITITKGSAVTWKNDDTSTHNVLGIKGPKGLQSASMPPGAAYTYTFMNVGTYQYRCTLHKGMTGEIIVTE